MFFTTGASKEDVHTITLRHIEYEAKLKALQANIEVVEQQIKSLRGYVNAKSQRNEQYEEEEETPIAGLRGR